MSDAISEEAFSIAEDLPAASLPRLTTPSPGPEKTKKVQAQQQGLDQYAGKGCKKGAVSVWPVANPNEPKEPIRHA